MVKPIFDEKSISSIGGMGKDSSQRLLLQIAGELNAHADDISALMAVTGFTTKNLSSMLNGARKDLAAGIDALVNNKDALAAIVKEGTFDAKSLSSMLHGAGAGKHLAAGIDALANNKDALAAIVKEGTFDANSLSSMLHGARKPLAAGIDALVSNKDALTAIVKEGPFDAKSLSSMLNGAGKDLAVGVDAVLSRMPELMALSTVFRPTQIATRLCSVSAKKMGRAIHEMHVQYSSEIAGNTLLPQGALCEILNASAAALKSEQRGV